MEDQDKVSVLSLLLSLPESESTRLIKDLSSGKLKTVPREQDRVDPLLSLRFESAENEPEDPEPKATKESIGQLRESLRALGQGREPDFEAAKDLEDDDWDEKSAEKWEKLLNDY
jgi:hypothetical protein